MPATVLAVGATMCYAAALPSATHREMQTVRVEQLQPKVSGAPGAFVRVIGGRLNGIEWHVETSELHDCPPLAVAGK